MLLVFWPTRHYEFINFDDPNYVSANSIIQAGLTRDSVRWAFTTVHASNWHPITWLSHMLDCQLFGLDAGAHHLVNVGFHATNALLLFVLLWQMTGTTGRSAVVAGLFGLHPLHVESVAWIAERKDLLSAFFGLLTLLAYVKYVRSKNEISKPKVHASSSRPWRWYVLALLLFALGLMSKPMLVTWPFVMLLLDYWPLARIQHLSLRLATGPSAPKPAKCCPERPVPETASNSAAIWPLIREKLPFFALTIGSCIITFLAQHRGGAVASLDLYPPGSRVMTAISAYFGYVKKTLWPAHLSIVYLPPDQWDIVFVLCAALVVAAITAVVCLNAATRSYLATGWFWYLGTLVPVIGLVQVGNQSMADRYMYLPSIGLFIMITWTGWALLEKRPKGWTIAVSVAAAVGLSCAWTTVRQVRQWRDSETLLTHCLDVTKNNYIVHNNLGYALMQKGEFDNARPHFEEALRLRPRYADALVNLGVLLTREGHTAEALTCLRQAAQVSPNKAEVFGNLAGVLALEGRFEDAIEYYQQAIVSQPQPVEALNNLAWLFATHPEARLRNGPEAVRLAERACELTSYKTALLVGTLGAAYAEAGRFEDAVTAATKAEALARASGNTELADKNRNLAGLYRTGQSLRSPPPILR